MTRRLVEGAVVHGHPRYERRAACDRCGRTPPGADGFAWWAPMYRPDDARDEPRVLGHSCADCHA